MTRLDKLSADMGKAVTALLLISSLSFSFPIQAIAEGIQQGPSAQVESRENLSEQETTAPRGGGYDIQLGSLPRSQRPK